MNNLLINKIYSIQDNYCKLLESIMTKLSERDNFAVLDEINIFWHSNFDAIKMYLRYYASISDSYMFTGATYLDIEDKEHLPFLLMGNIHILDDPLCRYSDSVSKIPVGKFPDELRRQIIITAKDNIEVIKKSNYNILILPIRILNFDKADNIIYEQGIEFFLNLFENEISSLDDYHKKCSTIKDIETYLTTEAIEFIVFNTDDKQRNLSFQERFLQEVSKYTHMLETDTGDSFIFFQLIYGYIPQAIEVILSCNEFNIVPYIRAKVPFQYFMLLSHNMIDIQDYKKIIDKACVAYVVHDVFDKQRIPNIDMSEYISRVDKYSFSNTLFEKITDPEMELSKIADIVEKELEAIYCEFN